MSTFHGQVEQCVMQLAAHQNETARELYKRVVKHCRDALFAKYKAANQRAEELLDKSIAANPGTERNKIVKNYRELTYERNAFNIALEILADLALTVPPPEISNKSWDSNIHSQLVTLAKGVAALTRENDKKKAKKQTSSRLRIRAAAKKSTRNK